MRFFFLCAGIPTEIFEQVRKERAFIGGTSTEVELLPSVGPDGTPYTPQYIGKTLQIINAKTKLDDKLDVPPAYAVLYLRAGNYALLTNALFPSIYTCPVEWDGLTGDGKMVIAQAKNALVKAFEKQATAVRTALTELKREMQEQAQRTPWLLPVRNFRSRHLRPALSNVQAELVQTNKKFNVLKDLNNRFRQNHPQQKQLGSRAFFIDERGLEFKPPGQFLHGFHHDESGESVHDTMCYIGSRRRLGVPYVKTFHYDCTLGDEKPVAANLCNCHSDEAVRKKAPKNFNIAPNDFTRP